MKLGFEYLTIWFILFMSFGAQGQLQNRALVDSLNDSSYYLGSSAPYRAITVARNSLKIARQLNYREGEIIAFCRIGNAQIELDQLDAALSNYEMAQHMFEISSVDSTLLVKILIYKSSIYRRQGKSVTALANYSMAFRIAQRHSNKVLMSSCLVNMSIIYKEQGDYRKALSLLHKARKVLPKTERDELGAIYNGLGNIYQDQGRSEEAISMYRNARTLFTSTKNLKSTLLVNINVGNCFFDLDQEDSALYYYHLALPISIEKSFKETEGVVYQNIGAVFAQRQMLDSASFYYNKSLDIKNVYGNLDGALESLKSIGEVELLRNNVDQALKVYEDAYKLALEFDYLEDLAHITSELSNCFEKTNEWDKAMHYLELSKCYRDTIGEKLSEAFVYEINYEQEKRNVAELKLNLKEKEAKIEKQQHFLWTLAILVFSLLVIFYILYKLNRQKRKSAEISIDNLKKTQEISDLIAKREQAELSAMFDGQEAERNRISQELHDNLGGILSTVKLYFRAIDKQINHLKDENVKKYEKATALLDEACDETRKIAYQLSSKRLNEIGLFATVKTLQNQINDSDQLLFQLHTHGDDDKLDRLLQNSVYRIIQELVTNITKHAKAKKVNVHLNVFHNIFNVIVEDDGVGFDVNNLLEKSGLGLREIEVRVKSMNGDFTIDSGRGVGTTINIDIPLN